MTILSLHLAGVQNLTITAKQLTTSAAPTYQALENREKSITPADPFLIFHLFESSGATS